MNNIKPFNARYDRQIKAIGKESQIKLKNTKVVCIGAGGLGCPLLLYLASSGVGNITIVDGDIVSLSNLHRQILFKENHIGKNKAVAAKEALVEINSDCNYVDAQLFISKANSNILLKDADLIIDCTDNFNAKYVINNASKHLNIPLISASIHKDIAHVFFLNYFNGPCYECVFSSPPPPEVAPSCIEAGVLGVNVGIIGLIQAKQCISYLTNRKISHNFLKIDLSTYEISRLSTNKSQNCIQHHGYKEVEEENCLVQYIDAPTLKKFGLNNVQLVDVRNNEERDIFSIGGMHIPLNQLSTLYKKLDTKKKTVVYCESGSRGSIAVNTLTKLGFIDCYNLLDGLSAWRRSIKPSNSN